RLLDNRALPTYWSLDHCLWQIFLLGNAMRLARDVNMGSNCLRSDDQACRRYANLKKPPFQLMA
ncbi:MAG: hypothetical protein AAF399_21810, partial [Bacteroidota bacterium]